MVNKVIVHPTILSLFTRPHVIPNLYSFLLRNMEDILKNAGNQTVWVTIDFHYIDIKAFFKLFSFAFHRRKKLYRFGAT